MARVEEREKCEGFVHVVGGGVGNGVQSGELQKDEKVRTVGKI